MSRLGVLLLSVTAPHAIRRFRRACRQPAEAQQERLRAIVTANVATAYGRRHHFDRVRSFADYQSLVPVSTYDDLQPYIAAAMAGQPEQLTRRAAGAVHHDQWHHRRPQVHPDDRRRAHRQATAVPPLGVGLLPRPPRRRQPDGCSAW